MRETSVKKYIGKGEMRMENLGHDVVETGLGVVSEQTCSVKKALPVVLPFMAVVGLVFFGVKVLKRNKAKKLALQTPAEEVNPEV